MDAAMRRFALRISAPAGLLIIAGLTFLQCGSRDSWIIAPAQAQRQDALVSEYHRLAKLHNSGKYQEFVERAPTFLAKVEARYGETDTVFEEYLSALAKALWNLGRYVESEPYFQRWLTVTAKIHGPNHRLVGICATYLGTYYSLYGRFGEAEKMYKRSLEIIEKTSNAEDIAASANNLAVLYDKMGRYAEAEALHHRALAVREKAFGPHHPVLSNSLINIAALYLSFGRDDEAEPLLRRALTILATPTANKWDGRETAFQVSWLHLATIFEAQGRYAEAETLLKRAIAIAEKKLGKDLRMSEYLGPLARLYAAQGRYADAESLLKRVLAIQATFGDDVPMVQKNLDGLATVYMHMRRYAEAEPLYRRALAAAEKTIGIDHPQLAPWLSRFATLKLATGQLAEALGLSRRSVQIAQTALSSHAGTAATIDVKTLRSNFMVNLEVLHRATDEKLIGPETGSEVFEVAQLGKPVGSGNSPRPDGCAFRIEGRPLGAARA
jgi:tetratricopeptide (TPR) repeat protein